MEENDFKAVVFHDHAKGLTGTKYSTKEEHDNINLDDANERLANFEEHKNIGISREGQSSGGFVGQGKLISNLHSKIDKIYYDSLRADGEYLINSRTFSDDLKNINLGDVLWGVKAEQEIQTISNGHLNKLKTTGSNR